MKIMKPLLVVGATDFDYNPEPNPEVGKAAFALADLASPGTTEQWADAGVGDTELGAGRASNRHPLTRSTAVKQSAQGPGGFGCRACCWSLFSENVRLLLQ